jgi:hypothetical protein
VSVIVRRRRASRVRRLHFDQYEFDTTGSEEELDIVVATTEQFRDLAVFIRWAGITDEVGSSAFERPVVSLSGIGRHAWVLEYLERFAGLQLAEGGEAILLRDDWDDLELVIVAGRHFVWYHWSTTA